MKKFIVVLLVMAACFFVTSGGAAANKKGEEVVVKFTSGEKVLMTARAELSPLPSRFTVDGTGYAGYFSVLKKSLGDRAALAKISPILSVAISELKEASKVPPKSAEVFFGKNGFSYIGAVSGLRVDEEKTINELIKNLNGRNVVVNVIFEKVRAKTEISDLKKINVQRSSFQTAVSGSAARRYNVALAAKRISGVTVFPGEEFSFNGVVGKRTPQNGFKEAVVITNGEYAKGVGGGVCQVSTTLYNAVLLAGLTVKTAAAHSLKPSYVLPGFDAMVSDYTDFVFRNDLDCPIYISAGYDGKNVWVKIYGRKSEYTGVKRTYRTIEEIPCKTVYVRDETLFSGEKVLFPGRNGLKVTGFLEYKIGGETYVVKIRTSVYRPEDRKIAIPSEKDGENF